MTISSETSKITYAGNGSASVFPVPFYFLANDEVKVIHTGDDGLETIWVEGTHYALTGAGAPGGGTLSISVSPTDHTPAEGAALTVKRDLDLIQETDYPEGGQFPASAHEQALDRIVMLLQQMDEAVTRSLKIPTSDTVGIDVEAAPANARSNKVVCYDDSGNLAHSSQTIATIEAGASDSAEAAIAAEASATAAAVSAQAAENSAAAAADSADAAASSKANAEAYAGQAAATLASAMWRDIVRLTSADSPYAISASDNGKLLVCDTTSGSISIQLAAVAVLGEPFNLSVKWEAGANPVTLLRAGTDTIDGANSYVLAENGSVMLIADLTSSPGQWEKIEINAITPLTFSTLPQRARTGVRLAIFNLTR